MSKIKSNVKRIIKKLAKFVLNNLPLKDESKQTLKRRINKLRKEPVKLITEFYKQYRSKFRRYIPIRYSGHSQYTIISAVYNVDKYLNDYFSSIVLQSLNFKKHIQIILVDDGSVDNSADTIKKWQKKYPKNIHYFYKENGGQASARNLGLQHLKTEWVTFIDPDDFIDAEYFKKVDDYIYNNKGLSMLVANLKFYIEKSKIVHDSHPLNFRFKQKKLVYPANNLENNINLSAAASFFKSEVIKNDFLFFNESVKPNFEDGKFIADYLLSTPSSSYVQFAPDVIYLYRKRENGNSTIDTSWEKEDKFGNVLVYGFIPMLNEYYDRLGYVPKHIQRTALYDVAWYIRYLLNKPEKLNFLSVEQKDSFQCYLEKLFDYIDEKEVLDFNLADMWFMHKVGMLGMFKHQEPPTQIVYVENIDREKKQILLTFFTNLDVDFSIKINGKDVVPAYIKNTIHTFNNRVFVTEKRLWVPCDNDEVLLTVVINQKQARISLKSKQYTKGIKCKDIYSAYNFSKKYLSDGSWLLMDRDVQADDNAEHLYRYLQQNYPKQRCYFALNRDSHDWNRLKQNGFNLVAYGTKEFENKLCRSSKIISSHLDRYINNYFGDEYEYSKKYVFLQHGVTKDDQSNWFNMKKNLQLIITATISEYHSLADDNNHYRLTKKEVALTGFPRHDNLLLNNQNDSRVIIIMPTWRQNLVGDVIGDGNTRVLNSNFMSSEYAKHWCSLLHSEDLKEFSNKYGYKVVFAPHANIIPYLSEFNTPDYIEVWNSGIETESMQKLFQRSSIMITDYSSVAFEVAYLGKMVIYYQFDKNDVFSGGHIYSKGYFSYEEHGFGPVFENEQDLLGGLELALKHDCEPFEPYATRIHETFPFRDGKNCERVYQAILALEEPCSTVNVDILESMLESSIQFNDWNLITERAEMLIQQGECIADKDVKVVLEAFMMNEKWNIAKKLLDQYSELSMVEERLQIAFSEQNWSDFINLYEKIDNPSFELSYKKLQALMYLNNSDHLEKFANQLIATNLSDTQRLVIQLWALYAKSDYEQVINLSQQLDFENLADTQLVIFYIKALVRQSNWKKALEMMIYHNLAKIPELKYERVLSYYRTGKIGLILSDIDKPEENDSYEYCDIVTEISLLMDNKELAKYCYRYMIAVYPDRNKNKNISALQKLL